MRTFLTMFMVLSFAACTHTAPPKPVSSGDSRPLELINSGKKNVCKNGDADYFRCLDGCDRIKNENKKRLCENSCDLICNYGYDPTE